VRRKPVAGLTEAGPWVQGTLEPGVTDPGYKRRRQNLVAGLTEAGPWAKGRSSPGSLTPATNYDARTL